METNDSDFSEFVNKLICAVQEQPCIYDKKHNLYFNKYEREKAWFDIAEKIGRSVDDCQRRWKLLRERLAKEVRKREKTLDCGKDFHTDWPCFDKILFLQTHIVPRKTVQNPPYIFVPVNGRDRCPYPSSDSNQTNTSLSNESEQQAQEKSTVCQRHRLLFHKRKSTHYDKTHRHHSSKRICQRIPNRSSSVDFELQHGGNIRNDRHRSNDNAINNIPLNNCKTEQRIKTERNAMEFEDMPDENDSMYEMGSLATRDQRVEGNGALFSNEQDAEHQYDQNQIDRDANNAPPSHSSTPTSVKQRRNTSKDQDLAQHSMSEDLDTLFGKIVTAMLKDISVEETKDNVKLHIMQMLIKAKRRPIKLEYKKA